MKTCPNCIEEMVVESDGHEVCFACGFAGMSIDEESKESLPDFYKEIMVEENGKVWLPQYFNGNNGSLYFDTDLQWVFTPKIPILESEKHMFPKGETHKADTSKAERVPMSDFSKIVTKYFINEG
jgi:hypothetical protein